MKKSLFTFVFASLVLTPARAVASTASVCVPQPAVGLCFTTITDQVDNNPPNTATPETFTQVLGINDGNGTTATAVGYYGSGTTPDHPNKGISFTVPNVLASGIFNKENFPSSAQTQVVGINNLSTPTTVGFWIDSAGNNFGFDKVGSTFTSVKDPATTGTVNQLLAVNDSNVAAGFYTDSAGNAHAYLFSIGTSAFTPINLPASFHAVSVTATGVNDGGLVSGFYTDTSGKTHGFLDNAGSFRSFDDPNGNGTNTMFLGLSTGGKGGGIVGSYVDAAGVTHGLSLIVIPLPRSFRRFGSQSTTRLHRPRQLSV